MTRRRFSTSDALVADLLARHERQPSGVNLIARIDDDGFSNTDQRDRFDEELVALERAGGLEFVHTGPKSERRLTGVRLRDVAVLYGWSGRLPAEQLAAGAVEDLRTRYASAVEVQRLIDDVVRAWTRGVPYSGLAVGDARTLGQVVQLAFSLRERSSAGQMVDQDMRTFSRLSVGDSKALEGNIQKVAAVATRLFPSSFSVELVPDELLASVGIGRLPQPVLIHGAVTWLGQPLPSMPYVGVPMECASGIEIVGRPDYILTIENFTSFVRHVREVACTERAIVIYSGGFPSRPTLATIMGLASKATAPTFHWGDMDRGGIRIFRYLERHLREMGIQLRPHLMEPELIRACEAPDQPLNPTSQDAGETTISRLAAFLDASGVVHEQEELDPKSPVAPCSR